MERETRKATDVLLEIESKVNVLLEIIRAQDLNIKVLSNKLNDLAGQLKQQQSGPPKITVETVQSATPPSMPIGFNQLPPGEPERNIPVTAESKLPQSNNPQGFRRTSRPETFIDKKISGDDVYINKPMEEVVMPIQMPPGRSAAESIPTTNNINKKQVTTQNTGVELKPTPQGQIPTIQRIVDKNGKSIFLADVEITDLSTGQLFFKTRTNGNGKWMASLMVGAYQVKISKRGLESTNKAKIEALQDIQVDGSQSPLELPMLIVK